MNLSAQKDSKLDEAKIYIKKNLKKQNLTQNDVAELRVVNEIKDNKTDITHLYLQQQVNGIDVIEGTMGVHFKGDKAMYMTSKFEENISRKVKTSSPSLSASDALLKATKNLKIKMNATPAIFQPATGTNQSTIFSKGEIADTDIPTKLVYTKNKDGGLVLAWQVEIYEIGQQHYWIMLFDANSGKLLSKRDMVISCDFGGTHLITDTPGEIQHNHKHAHSHNHAPAKRSTRPNMILPGIPKSETNLESLFAVGDPHSYRVLPEPLEAPNDPNANQNPTNFLVDISTAGDAVASPYGWHSTDGTTENASTIGNNVNATNDPGAESPQPVKPKGPAMATNIPPVSPFEFHHDADLTMGPETYTDAAIVNLFYWNNIVHDIFYQFGFDEANGNFQTTNTFNGTMKGGPMALANDAVIAEAQDGEALNNANMLTLPDGSPPRMQMYLWSSTTAGDIVFFNTINGTASNKKYIGIEAAFGTGNNLDATGITGDIVLIDANSNAPGSDNEGCGTGQGLGLPPDNQAALAGNLVLIKRGSCAFAEKVSSAQLAGATAVIIYNNVPGAGPISMGGGETGNSVTIPAVSISFEDGNDLLAEMAMGTVNLTLKNETPNLLIDGDYDNGIIAHEYGHGISNRLTGGPGALGPLGGDEQQGEGWSDYFALYLALQSNDLGPATGAHPNGVLPNHGIGTYVFKQDFNTGGGIRPAPYSTDMAVNNFTYKDVNRGAEITVPHGVGFIWCTMLQEMTQNIIDIVPINDDLYHDGISAGAGGNNIALQLVMEGLKLQSTSPTFVQARDGILMADTMLYAGAYSCAIWDAFAKRGLGLQATSGTNAIGDEFENYDTPLSCGGQPNPIIEFSKASSGVVANGEEITFDIVAQNNSEIYPATNVVITDNLPANMFFVSATNGGTHNAGVVTFPTIASIPPGGFVTRSITAIVVKPGTLAELFFEDKMENGAGNWTVNNVNTTMTGWELQNNDPFSGSNVWFSTDSVMNSDNTLTFANPFTVEPGMILSFYHQFAMESEFDGGVVEISTNGGTTWESLADKMIQNGYNDAAPATNNPAIGGPMFSGASGGYIETRIDLSSFNGGPTALIRFRLSNDVGTFVQGWWIDDVRLFSNPVFEVNTANYVDAINITPITATAPALVVEEDVNCNFILYYPDTDGDGDGDVTSPGNLFCDGAAPPGFVTNQNDCDDTNASQDLAVITPTPQGHYFAPDQLSSNGALSTTNSVIFQAGFEVVMSPGFVAAVGSDFHAYIDPDCPFTPPMPLQEEGEDLEVVQVKNQVIQTNEADKTDEVVSKEEIVDDKLRIYPNPTSDETTFEISVGASSQVNMAVFDTKGNMINNLLSNQQTDAGVSKLSYNTSNLANGVYMVVLKTERKTTVERLVIIRE